VLYDANCGLCVWLLSGLLRWDRARALHPIALQRSEADELLGDLTPGQRMASWHLVSPARAGHSERGGHSARAGHSGATGHSGDTGHSGATRYSAGAALPALLRELPAGRLPAAGFARFPGLTEHGYRWVAEHRSELSRWVPSSAKRRARRYVQRRERDRATP